MASVTSSNSPSKVRLLETANFRLLVIKENLDAKEIAELYRKGKP
jgi:hypothetical protein